MSNDPLTTYRGPPLTLTTTVRRTFEAYLTSSYMHMSETTGTFHHSQVLP